MALSLCAPPATSAEAGVRVPGPRRFLVIANPYLSVRGKPPIVTGYVDPDSGTFVAAADEHPLERWWTPFPGRAPIQWNGTVISGLGYWSAGDVAPDQWSEGEADSIGLGPGVRGVPGEETLYYVVTNNDGTDDEQELQLHRRVRGADTLLQTWKYNLPGSDVIQALRLEVWGMPPTLAVFYRMGRSGEPGTGGYDPLEYALAAWPWQLAGCYVDSAPEAIPAGRPALWYSIETGGEATTHWSWGLAENATSTWLTSLDVRLAIVLP